MLFGKFEHNLDDKFRLTIPSKLRNKLGELVYVTRSIDGNCLEIRTPENFKEWCNELKSQSALSTSTRTVVRTIFSNTDELSIDNAGRIKIPTNLLEEVGISKTVQITGAGEWIEIWDKDKHLIYDKDAKIQLIDEAEKLGGVN